MRYKIDIYNVQQQLKDFFNSDNGVVLPPKNPFNIKWLVENSPINSAHRDIALSQVAYINETLEQNHVVSIRNGSVLSQYAYNEELVIKRLEFLIEQGASIKDEGLALVRHNSFPIFKKAIEWGLDVNKEHKGNYPLRYAIYRKSGKIAELLFNMPEVKKDIFDKNGETVIHNLIEKKNFRLLIKVWESSPVSFLVHTQKGLSILDLFKNLNNDVFNIDSKYGKSLRSIVLSLLSHYANSHNEEDTSCLKRALELNKATLVNPNPFDIRSIWVEYNYNKLNKELYNTTEFRKKLKI